MKNDNSESAKRGVEMAFLYDDNTWETKVVFVPASLGNKREAIVTWVERHAMPNDTVATQLYDISDDE